MRTQTVFQTGQQLARTRWNTHESGEAFDQKKSPYLTERAQQFMAQQAMCMLAGLTPDNRLDGVLVLGQPGFVQVLDASTCLLRLEIQGRASGILQRLHHVLSIGQVAWLSLFFICHPTRERLCVHATVELLASDASAPFRSPSSAPSVVVRLHVQEAFFHCSKYIRTRVAGLTVPVPHLSFSQQRMSSLDMLKESQRTLSEEYCSFLTQQVLCFLCTVNREGRCAVNHRGGTPGFLVPNYVAQVALCVSGAAYVMEAESLHGEVARRCRGAERVIALEVQSVGVQSGDWSALLAYECARAASIWTTHVPSTCALM